jgi:hypothetical protein
MIIKVNSTALCAGIASNEHVGGMNSACRRVLQDSRPIRAAAAVVYNRANLSTIREFTVHKLHADLETAEEYINVHEATVMGLSGAITFEAEPAASGDTATLSNAYVESVELIQWTGCTTVWKYRIRGGVLTVA